MRSRLAVAVCLLLVAVLAPAISAQTQVVRSVSLARASSFPAPLPINASAGLGPEFDSALAGNDPDADSLNSDASGQGIALNRSVANGPGNPVSQGGSRTAKSNPELFLSVDALNHFAQRFVAGGRKSVFG